MTTPKRILLVEDEYLIALNLEQELKWVGYNVLKIISSGEKAVSFACEQVPDVIIMDINLAGRIDGIEATRQIQTFSSIPIIIMTGYPDLEIQDRYKTLDFVHYLIKPVKIHILKHLIDSLPC